MNMHIFAFGHLALCSLWNKYMYCILRRIVLDINLSLHLLTAWILLVCYKSIYCTAILFYLLLFYCIYNIQYVQDIKTRKFLSF
jgi:hypothetical protein